MRIGARRFAQDTGALGIMPAADPLVIRMQHRHRRHFQELYESGFALVPELGEGVDPKSARRHLQFRCSRDVTPGDGSERLRIVRVQADHALHCVAGLHRAQLPLHQHFPQGDINLVEDLPVEKLRPGQSAASGSDLCRPHGTGTQLGPHRRSKQHHSPEGLHLLDRIEAEFLLIFITTPSAVEVFGLLLNVVRRLVVLLVLRVHPSELLRLFPFLASCIGRRR
mmetsp:Transcript_81309/g.235039  ORF Transcript_81309/g.235039 Transcript_81309/m.235039 type:complete len:224 (+) Transcript_81309:217-888(+)